MVVAIFVLAVLLVIAVVALFLLARAFDKEIVKTQELEKRCNDLEAEVISLRKEKASRPGRCKICNRFAPVGRDICNRCLNT